MGGNLFKESKRIDTIQFNTICSQIGWVLENKLGLDNCPVKFFNNKEEHGDIDILVFKDLSYDTQVLINTLKEFPTTTKIKKNGNVISILYDNVQVDLILIDKVFKETAKLFFFYNDFGLLLGKIFYYNRLKFSPEGVKYKVKYLQYSGEINLFTDIDDTFNYLGLDKCRYDQGFDSLEDMFEYIISSKKFCKESFDKSLWRSDQRHRDLKRKNLLYFYEWIKDKDLPSIERPSKEEVFEFANNITDGEVKELFNYMVELDELKKRIAFKFNSNFLMETFPVLKDYPKYLGIFIRTFKDNFDDDEHFCDYLELTDKEEYLDDLEKHLHQLGF